MGQCLKGLSGFYDPNIHTALKISKSLGWNRVAALKIRLDSQQ